MASSSALRSGTPSTLAQVHAYRHLAPPYAAVSSDAASKPPPTSSAAPPLSDKSSLRPFTAEEVRQIVLDYLCHEGYVDSATAFAREMVADGAAESGESGAARAAGPADPAPDDEREPSRDAMEGVEATPEPTGGGSAATAAGSESAATVTEVSHAHSLGKNVAFLDVDGEAQARPAPLEPEEEEGVPSALSRAELRDLRLRTRIREAITEGRVTQAVDLLNEHYPAVLSPAAKAPLLSGATAPSSFSRPAASVRTTEASCTPQSFFVAPTPPPRTASPDGLSQPASMIPTTGARFGPWALSLAPEIVALNLQTQSFIELMRTAHATSAISMPSTPTSSVHGGVTSNGAGDAHSDAEMSGSASSLGGSASILNTAIAQSQALREKVLRLPAGTDREGWEKESIDVCGLLAYKDLATCPVRGYLAQERRDVLAEMVNSAILQRTGGSPLSVLSLAARQAVAIWDTLREMNHPFPPAEAITIGRDRDSNNGKIKPMKTYPVFDLPAFLAETSAPGASADAVMQ